MNRNVESHFSELPSVDIQRSIFDRSFTHKTSFNVSELVPFYVDEVLLVTHLRFLLLRLFVCRPF